MALKILGANGIGNEAYVTGNRLHVDAKMTPRVGIQSRDNGSTFSWASGTYDADANDTILLVKNTSTTQNLYVTTICLSTDVETRVVIHLPTTDVTVAGTTITGTNLNTVSANVASASAARDETGNSQGNIIWSGEIQAATNPFSVEFFASIVLGQNKSIAVDYVADVAACDVNILGFYE